MGSDLLLTEPITMPAVQVQKKLSTIFDVINHRFASVRRGSQILETFRDTLLPKLISGELRLKDAGRFMAEATA